MAAERVIAAALLACIASSPGEALASAQSYPAQQSLGGPPPAWVARPPADDSKNYSFVGSATSASESQARTNAYDDAARKAVSRIAARLFRDPGVVTWYGTDALRDYVRKVGRNAGQYVRPNRGAYTAYVWLQLSAGFVEPSALRQYAASPAVGQPGAAIGYLLVPPDIGQAPVMKRTQVRMSNLRQGNFYFYFSLASTKGQVWTRLDQIQVVDDGSAGTTRWKFDVLVNGRKAFGTAIAAYSDDVVTYRMRAGDPSVEARTPADGLIEIKVVGTRVSAAAAK